MFKISKEVCELVLVSREFFNPLPSGHCTYCSKSCVRGTFCMFWFSGMASSNTLEINHTHPSYRVPTEKLGGKASSISLSVRLVLRNKIQVHSVLNERPSHIQYEVKDLHRNHFLTHNLQHWSPVSLSRSEGNNCRPSRDFRLFVFQSATDL